MSALIHIDVDGRKRGADPREMSDEQRQAAAERLSKAGREVREVTSHLLSSWWGPL